MFLNGSFSGGQFLNDSFSGGHFHAVSGGQFHAISDGQLYTLPYANRLAKAIEFKPTAKRYSPKEGECILTSIPGRLSELASFTDADIGFPGKSGIPRPSFKHVDLTDRKPSAVGAGDILKNARNAYVISGGQFYALPYANRLAKAKNTTESEPTAKRYSPKQGECILTSIPGRCQNLLPSRMLTLDSPREIRNPQAKLQTRRSYR